MSPRLPHRFSALALPSPSFHSSLQSPKSPSLMSPPMSARSFGTFIDSEPSTPAYSPRPDFGWDSSTLVLLQPVSSSSEPSSPIEPSWNSMASTKLRSHTRKATLSKEPKEPVFYTPRETPIASPASYYTIARTMPIRSPQPLKEIKVIDLCQKEYGPRAIQLDVEENEENEIQEDQSTNAAGMPLSKLAAKMKGMLRRRTLDDKKKQKKEKVYYEVERLSDEHWTEM